MHLNTTPDPPPAKPCIRDMAELLRDHLPPAPVLKALPLAELARRCHEIAAEHQRFREETPLVLKGETARRQRFQVLRPAQVLEQPQVA
jgi:hypothetical protein